MGKFLYKSPEFFIRDDQVDISTTDCSYLNRSFNPKKPSAWDHKQFEKKA